MTATQPTDADIERHAREAADAAGPHGELLVKQQQLRQEAAANDAKVRALEARRQDILPTAFLGDPKIDAELANIGPHIDALQRRRQDALDAASRLEPAIAEVAKEAQRTAKALNELRHRRLVDEHAVAAAALRDGLGPLLSLIDTYVTTGAAVNRSHRDVHGEPEPRESYEPAAFRALRFLNIALHHKYGGDARALEIRFEPRFGTL